ncbi:MAG TPA: hypothetical protein VEK11_15760 [Thermoanaerobaculia bacterium]|nr:hypothetical protein [Thermoanaerobaculia bacterium]
MPNQVIFHNNAGFATSFSIQWNGGETGRTEMTTKGDTITLDLTRISIPEGTSCWARAYVQGGPNHDSGDNFNYSRADTSTAVYTISGGTLNPSFSLSVNPSRLLVSIKTASVGDAGSRVKFFDDGAFSGNFSVQWNGGETLRTETVNSGQSTNTVDLTQYTQLAAGTSCWARVYIAGGVNHDSARNFTYDPNNDATIQYTVTGGSLTPSFD